MIQMYNKIIVYNKQKLLHNINKRCCNMWKIQKGYDTVSKSFRLPVELVDELDKLAYENNLSLNQLVIQCLNFALENLDKDETDEIHENTENKG